MKSLLTNEIRKKRLKFAYDMIKGTYLVMGIQDEVTEEDIRNLFQRYGWPYITSQHDTLPKAVNDS